MAKCSDINCTMGTMQLNDMKAGMQGLNKEAINKVIYEASKGTPYFVHQQKRQQRIDNRINEMLAEVQEFTDVQSREAKEKMEALSIVLESTRDLSHSIVHIDMDAFYAAVEMRDNPELRLKPMAVGSNSMLSTSNYEARKYGVRAAMPGFIAKKLCPELIIVGCNFDKYKKVSKQVMNIVKDYDPNYSASSLDEVYLDLTPYILKMHCKPSDHNGLNQGQQLGGNEELDVMLSDGEETSSYHLPANAVGGSKMESNRCECNLSLSEQDKHAFGIVQEIRKRIFDATQLTASAGIAPNTMLAKVCSDQNKPNGQFQIPSDREEVKKFISTLAVKKVSGIGPVQSQLLNALGIITCSQLWQKRDLISLLFTLSSAEFYIRVSLGLGSAVVKSDYVRKSIGVETTFQVIEKVEELHQKCEELCEEMIEDLKSHGLVGKVVILKLKTVNFDAHTRNHTLPSHSSDKGIIFRAVKKLLDNEVKSLAPKPLKLRLMGVRMSNLLQKDQLADDKQVKLKDFLQMKATVSLRTESNASGSKFTCPLCKFESTASLEEFNDHIDHCLLDTELAESTDFEKVELKHQEHSSSMNEVILTEEKLQSNRNSVLCPVCGVQQMFDEPNQVNIHIDNCLSQVAIKELLSRENQERKMTEKRKNISTSQRGKRTKLENTRKINEYFQ